MFSRTENEIIDIINKYDLAYSKWLCYINGLW